ncbi:MAG: NAD-dependent epimerase/dehydratase family protein [Chloroflexi bacterium]|nr:MAG: NAD-dependent epimerase/dehydratase family protein [Chloroflexota bacterium]
MPSTSWILSKRHSSRCRRCKQRSSIKKMRIGITGASGFIGSHVVDALAAAGHVISVIDVQPPHRNDIEFRKASVLDAVGLIEACTDLDVLYHLAAVADVNDVVADPAGAIDLNVTGTLRALEAARSNAIKRFVLASTVWVYSSAESSHSDMVDERAAMEMSAARHVYTTSKIAAEMLCHDYWSMHKLPFTILRYGIPYGPRMRLSLVMPVFVRKALSGEALTVSGDGSQHRKFVYVEDLARGHVAALAEVANNQTYNLDGSEKVTILRIAETVLRLTACRSEIQFMAARPGDYSGRDVSSEKARRQLHWTPEIDFEEGMKRTVPWLVEKLREEAVVTAPTA